VTQRTHYTSDEWTMLKIAPELVGFAMMSVSRSGPIGKLRELGALSRCLTPRALPVQFKGNELVRALLQDAHGQAVGPFTHLSRNDPGGLIIAIATLRLRALVCCEQVAALLAAKARWAEADGMKRWLLWIATRVAEASGDRWLGFGRRVSEAEAAVLDQMATALHSSCVGTAPTAAELEAMLGLAPHDAELFSGGGDGQEHTRRCDG